MRPRGQRAASSRQVPISDVLIENAASALQKSLQAEDAVAGSCRSGVRLAEVGAAGDAEAESRGHAERSKTKAAAAVKTQIEVIPGRHGAGPRRRRERQAAADRRRDAGEAAAGIPGRARAASVLGEAGALAGRVRHVRRAVCAVRILHLSPRAADYRRSEPAGDAAGAGRGHRDADDHHQQRRLAGGTDSADAVRHDDGDCLSTGNRAVAVGGRDADQRRRHWACAWRTRSCCWRRRPARFCSWAACAAAASCCRSDFVAAGVAALTTLGVGTLEGEPLWLHAEDGAAVGASGPSSPAR